MLASIWGLVVFGYLSEREAIQSRLDCMRTDGQPSTEKPALQILYLDKFVARLSSFSGVSGINVAGMRQETSQVLWNLLCNYILF